MLLGEMPAPKVLDDEKFSVINIIENGLRQKHNENRGKRGIALSEKRERPYVRASSIGYCQRATLLSMRENENNSYEDGLQSIFAMRTGTAIHEILQEALGIDAENRSGKFSSELKVESEDSDIVGHYDWQEEIGETGVVLEIKSMHVDAYQDMLRYNRSPYPNYVRQANLYMKMTNSAKAVIVIVNKNGRFTQSFLDEVGDRARGLNPMMTEFVIDFNQELWDDSEAIADNIIEHYENGTLPSYKSISQCRWCKYASSCLDLHALEKADRRLERSAERQAAKAALKMKV